MELNHYSDVYPSSYKFTRYSIPDHLKEFDEYVDIQYLDVGFYENQNRDYTISIYLLNKDYKVVSLFSTLSRDICQVMEVIDTRDIIKTVYKKKDFFLLSHRINK